MRIKEVEDLVGITRKNIRFYEKEGLLTPGRELENSYRDYTEDDIARLRIIKLLRRLEMPISEISDVLEHRISLHEAVHLHALLLEERKRSLDDAQRICCAITEDGAELATLDPEAYLKDMLDRPAGTALSEGAPKSSTGKYREPLIVSIVIIILFASLGVFLVSLSHSGHTPGWVSICFVALMAAIIIGVILALCSRIKEVKRGEENDISQY